jgi:hypothetical protein
VRKEQQHGTRTHYVAVRRTPCGYCLAVHLPCYLVFDCRMCGAAASATRHMRWRSPCIQSAIDSATSPSTLVQTHPRIFTNQGVPGLSCQRISRIVTSDTSPVDLAHQTTHHTTLILIAHPRRIEATQPGSVIRREQEACVLCLRLRA